MTLLGVALRRAADSFFNLLSDDADREWREMDVQIRKQLKKSDAFTFVPALSVVHGMGVDLLICIVRTVLVRVQQVHTKYCAYLSTGCDESLGITRKILVLGCSCSASTEDKALALEV